MLVLKVLILHFFWFAVVLSSHSIHSIVPILASILLVALNFTFYRPSISLGRYIFTCFIFTLAGLVHDGLLVRLGLVDANSYSYSLLALWIVFISYYGDVLNKFKSMSPILLFLLGGVGGGFAYWSGQRLGALEVYSEYQLHYLIYVFFFWGVFFPMSIKLFYNGDYWNKFLDKTIFFSFDKTGFDRHSSTFNEDIYSYRLDSSVLVTGGTSGIGEEVAHQLSQLGARVMVTGRNEGKGQKFVSSHEKASFSSLDMTDWKMIKSFAENSPVFDHIVLNAGSMPNKKEVNDFQVEHQCASQLLGHYFLIHFLLKYKKLNASSRIIWVSSGGMYLKKIDLDSMFINEQYEKVATYANIKRAQITLVEELVKTEEWKNSQMVSMHPGWVATDGLKEALPGFSRLVGKRLRSAKEGADTIVWLVATKSAIQPGAFYFDRSKVSAYINDSFNPTTLQRETLMNKIHSYLKEFEKREN